MRATILPMVIILTKANKAPFSMTDKSCIVVCVMPLRRFLFLLPNFFHVYAIIIQLFSYLDKREVLEHAYMATPNP